MKTYYSIVSIATNSKLNEKFNIGLLCVTSEQTFFHFSKDKFKIVSKLLSTNGRKLAMSALKGMEDQICNTSASGEALFGQEGMKLQAVSEPYIAYLNRYNNNLVQYSTPVTIDLDVDYTVFKTLFKKYVYRDEVFYSVIEPKAKTFVKIRNSFRKEAKLMQVQILT